MSGHAAASSKPRTRNWLLKPFKSLSRGRSPSPSASSTTITSSPLNKTPSSNKSSTFTPIATSGQPRPGVIAQPSGTVSTTSCPPSSSSTISSNSDILNHALQKLSDSAQATLRPFIHPTNRDVNEVLERSLTAAKQKQRESDAKRWVFTFAGRTVTLKDEADKIVRWLDRFKAVGDVAVNADPVLAGLPWAGVRLLLEVAVADAKQMASLLVGCETALYMINRLKAYLDFLTRLPASLTRTNFEAALTEMSAHLLAFLANAIEIYQCSTTRRVFTSFWQDRHVETEASNCDRTLAGQDREVLKQLRQELHVVLGDIQQIRLVQASLDRLERKMDLSRLRVVEAATFDAYGQIHRACHTATRVDLLQSIHNWAQQPASKSIFWLSGAAGTGKSTISWTVAEKFADGGAASVVKLGASFFFKRGEGDRGSAALLFPTIARQLAMKVDGYDVLVAKAVDVDPSICSKSLGEQFDKLLRRPLQQLAVGTNHPTYLIVVDALDECETKDIPTVLQLWSELPHFTRVHLRLFLTSRPDLPVLSGFDDISVTAHLDVNLQEETRSTIQDDLSVFLRDTFVKMRDQYNRRPRSGKPLDSQWPGEANLQELVDMANPLFIVATTVCLFVSDPNWEPHERLTTILQTRRTGQMSQMAQTYLPVLQQLTVSLSDHSDRERLCSEFRTIVGAIVTLVEPLSRTALAALLHVPSPMIALRLHSLHSVLEVPLDATTPIRPLHLSFGEFLTRHELQSQPFGVNGPTTHGILLSKCLELLSRPNPIGLHENMCKLNHPGQSRQQLAPGIIQGRLPPAVQYACRYWTYHAQSSGVNLRDEDKVHEFLQKHFLHWLEALSLLDRLTDAITYVGILQTIVSPENSIGVSSFLEDARRFVLAYRAIGDLAPLQLHSSAIIFSPQLSIVREVCGLIPAWIQQCPIMPVTWSAELQILEGHTGAVSAVAFSPDGSLLASASWDKTVRVWSASTGQEVQKLEGHTGGVHAVAFSPDGSLLASASWDKTVRVWSASTGQEVQKLEGHTNVVSAVAFSPDGSLLASASDDETVRVWSASTGQEVQKLEGHTDMVNAVAFSPDGSLLASASDDQTARVWSASTGQEVQKLEGHTDRVQAVAFPPDGSLLASASSDRTVRVWSASTGQEVQKLEGHTRGVHAVAFSPDGSLLASASDDETVRVWSATTGREVQKLEDVGYINQLSFTLDHSTLVTNRGYLRIDAVSTSVMPSDPGINHGLVLKHDWIEYNGERVLWLPQEYRSGRFAFHGDTFAIGANNGSVSFLRIKYT